MYSPYYSTITQEAISSMIATNALGYEIALITDCLNKAVRNNKADLLKPIQEHLNEKLIGQFNNLRHSPGMVITKTCELNPISLN